MMGVDVGFTRSATHLRINVASLHFLLYSLHLNRPMVLGDVERFSLEDDCMISTEEVSHHMTNVKKEARRYTERT